MTKEFWTLTTAYRTIDAARIVAGLYIDAGFEAITLPDAKQPGVFRVRVYRTNRVAPKGGK